jgi:hypothetical protein
MRYAVVLLALFLIGCADKSTDVGDQFDCTAGPQVSTRETSESLLVDSVGDLQHPCRLSPYSTEELVIDFRDVSREDVDSVLRVESLEIVHQFPGENSFICRIDRSARQDSIKARDLAIQMWANHGTLVRWAEPFMTFTAGYYMSSSWSVFHCSIEMLTIGYRESDWDDGEFERFADEHCLVRVDTTGMSVSWYLHSVPYLEPASCALWWALEENSELQTSSRVSSGLAELSTSAYKYAHYRLDRSAYPAGVLAYEYSQDLDRIISLRINPDWADKAPLPLPSGYVIPLFRRYRRFVDPDGTHAN